MEPDKKYYWQKTGRCAQCAFGDDPSACHYYGYRFWPELPPANDCWQFITPGQWKELLAIRNEPARLERWDQIRHLNHPGLPAEWQPPYKPSLKRDPSELSEEQLRWWKNFKD